MTCDYRLVTESDAAMDDHDAAMDDGSGMIMVTGVG